MRCSPTGAARGPKPWTGRAGRAALALMICLGPLVVAKPASASGATTHEIGEQPPAAKAELQLKRIDRRGLVGSVTCNREMEVDVGASVNQDLPHHAPVWAFADDERFEPVSCVPGHKSRFVLPLMGFAVLRPGPAQVSAFARWGEWPNEGYTYLDDTVRVKSLVDLWNPEPDGGPNTIHIDRRGGASAEAPLVPGTVTCDTPRTIGLSVAGRQLHHGDAERLDGVIVIPCDGATEFAIPVSGRDDGTLLETGPFAGSADVTVATFVGLDDAADFESSRASSRVRLPRPPDGGHQWPAPVPWWL